MAYVAFSPANDAIVIVAANQVRVYDLHARRSIGRTVAHDGPIYEANFSADRRWIVTASGDQRARIWEVASGLPASDWYEHDGPVISANFSATARKLVTASTDGRIKVWDVLGTSDATGDAGQWLARLAELISGVRIDPRTNEVRPAPYNGDAVDALRQEIARECRGVTSHSEKCVSDAGVFIRGVLGIAATTVRQER